MKITNDIVSFEPKDFEGLSQFAKLALPVYSGTTPFLETFANDINNHIKTAKSIAKKTVSMDAKFEAVVEGIALANASDPQKRADAETALDQLISILGVPVKEAADAVEAVKP